MKKKYPRDYRASLSPASARHVRPVRRGFASADEALNDGYTARQGFASADEALEGVHRTQTQPHSGKGRPSSLRQSRENSHPSFRTADEAFGFRRTGPPRSFTTADAALS